MMMSGLARSPASIRLEAQRGIALRDARGVELTVVSGGLWVTMEDDPRDVILKAGDSRPIERNGQIGRAHV